MSFYLLQQAIDNLPEACSSLCQLTSMGDAIIVWLQLMLSYNPDISPFFWALGAATVGCIVVVRVQCLVDVCGGGVGIWRRVIKTVLISWSHSRQFSSICFFPLTTLQPLNLDVPVCQQEKLRAYIRQITEQQSGGGSHGWCLVIIEVTAVQPMKESSLKEKGKEMGKMLWKA